MFGKCTKPVTCGLGGLKLGNGAVFPEVNYTLPAVTIGPDTIEWVCAQYRRMVGAILGRAADLKVPGLVLEFEHPFELTMRPEWGAKVTAETKELMREFHGRSGIPCALRVTIADIRDKTRPPRMRTGEELVRMKEAFHACAKAGGDILSIESTGGKEVSDEALMGGDLRGVLFGMCVLGGRDMAFLWDAISGIALETGTVSGGDSACGFGNTAMRLADMNYISRVFAAVVRAMSAARSLVAYDHGAVGPSKDCAYEGVYLKALRGIPIALEGKSAACAHFSHIGNISQAYGDLWSNESVQDVKLLAGYAPEVFAEVLIYDCRLMNEALRRGEEERLRDWLVASDALGDPQAYVLSPEVITAVAADLGREKGPYRQGLAAARTAAAMIAAAADRLALSPREMEWLDRIRKQLDGLPGSEEEFIAAVLPGHEAQFLKTEYGL